VMCLERHSGPRLHRAWKRRHWIEHCFRTLKPLTGDWRLQVTTRMRTTATWSYPGWLLGVFTRRAYLQGRLTWRRSSQSEDYWRL